MALGNGFKTNTSNAAPRSKWGGVKSAMPRTPILENFGKEYDLELVSYEETRNPNKGTETYKVTVKVIESDDPGMKPGSEAVILYSKHGKSLEAGMSKLKATSVAFAGFPNDEEYDAADPDGDFISNTFTGTGQNLIGEKAHVKVLRGQEKDNEPGKYWPEYEWTPLAQG
jgi:hypothetical protein